MVKVVVDMIEGLTSRAEGRILRGMIERAKHQGWGAAKVERWREVERGFKATRDVRGGDNQVTLPRLRCLEDEECSAQESQLSIHPSTGSGS